MFSAGQITSSYVSAGGSGTLTVSSGGQVVAGIECAGTYSAGNFHISSGIGGTVKITDPGVVDGGSVQFGNGQAPPACMISPSTRSAPDPDRLRAVLARR